MLCNEMTQEIVFVEAETTFGHVDNEVMVLEVLKKLA